MATADLEPVSIDSRRAWFAEHSPMLVHCGSSKMTAAIAGWISFQSFYGRPAYHATAELSVYVAADAQRRGYARMLVADAMGRAPDFG